MTRTLTDLGLVELGERCGCLGDACGREHLKAGDGRCYATDQPGHPLALVVPGHTAAQATRLPADRRVALCHTCARLAEANAASARAEAHAQAEATGPNLLNLLDSPDLPAEPSHSRSANR